MLLINGGEILNTTTWVRYFVFMSKKEKESCFVVIRKVEGEYLTIL